MGCHVYSFCNFCWFIRLVSLAVIYLFPCYGESKAISNFEARSLALEVVSDLGLGKLNHYQGRFTEFETQIINSSDPISKGREFLQVLITHLNEEYGANLTVHELCKFIITDLSQFPADPNNQKIIEIINFWESQALKEQHQLPLVPDLFLRWPFSLQRGNLDLLTLQTTTLDQLPGQLSAGTVVGGLEIIAGTAVGICFGTTVVGGIVAGGLIADGLTRIADAGQSDFEQAIKGRPKTTPYPEY